MIYPTDQCNYYIQVFTLCVCVCDFVWWMTFYSCEILRSMPRTELSKFPSWFLLKVQHLWPLDFFSFHSFQWTLDVTFSDPTERRTFRGQLKYFEKKYPAGAFKRSSDICTENTCTPARVINYTSVLTDVPRTEFMVNRTRHYFWANLVAL